MKEKRKLNPLKKGERVRVYGWVQMHHSPYKPRALLASREEKK